MKRLLLTTAFSIISYWMNTPNLAHAQSGIISFSGIIYEPPCLFNITSNPENPIQLKPICPRPATAQISLQDFERKQPIKIIEFEKVERTIQFPRKDEQNASKLIISVSYM